MINTLKILVRQYSLTSKNPRYQVINSLDEGFVPVIAICNNWDPKRPIMISWRGSQESAQILCGLCNLFDSTDPSLWAPCMKELVPGFELLLYPSTRELLPNLD